MVKMQTLRGRFGQSINSFYWLIVEISTLEIIEHKLYQNVTDVQHFDRQPQLQAWTLGSFLFDVMLHVHGKQLWSCREGHLLNHTFPEQVFRRQFTSIKCRLFYQ